MNPGDMFAESYTAEKMQTILLHQKTSLTHFLLYLFEDDAGAPDFSAFTALETLQLSSTALVKTPLETAWRKLSAPQLRNLIIDFGNSRETACDDLIPKEYWDWLMAFFALPMPDQRFQNCHLELDAELAPHACEARVLHNGPGGSCHCIFDRRGASSKWLEPLRDLMAKQKIQLSFVLLSSAETLRVPVE